MSRSFKLLFKRRFSFSRCNHGFSGYSKPENAASAKKIQLNPAHTVPTLVDGDLVLCDSHAIMPYLIGTYAKDKSLYPEDIKDRARVDHRLHFDCGLFVARLIRIGIPILLHGVKVIGEEHIKGINECYDIIEAFLQNSNYIAGDNLSIADLSVVATILNTNVLVPFDKKRCPKLAAWKKVMETQPYYDINRDGEEFFKSAIAAKLAK